MNILILKQIKEVAEEEEWDFTHGRKDYRFRSRKFAEVVREMSAHIDCIDNEYTGDPLPLYARVYFGETDSNSIEVIDDAIKDYGSGLILFAKESFTDDDDYEIESDTRIVSNDTDMWFLREAYIGISVFGDFLRLYKKLGKTTMENAAVWYQGCGTNGTYWSLKEAKDYYKKCKEEYNQIVFV